MLKSLFWMGVGAAGALEADRWMRRQKERWRLNAMTGSLLDSLNRKLEEKRAQGTGGMAPGPGDRI